MKALTLGFAAVAMTSVFATPEVTINQFAQTPSRLIKINYTLSEDAIVTFDIQTNGVSVGGQNLWTVEGEVNRAVTAGTYNLRWWPLREAWDRPANAPVDWQPPRIDLAGVRAVFTLWSAKHPPNYMVVNLTDGSKQYFAEAEALPGGVQDVRYKSSHAVLRLCPMTDNYMMGSANPYGTDHWIQGTRRPYHQVKFTKDFYIGVYEFTQGQYKTVTGDWPSSSWGTKSDRRAEFPMDGNNSILTHNKLRGGNDWPTRGHDAIDANSLLGKINAKAKATFDLPTEAQWEYACRGGRAGCTIYNKDGFIYYNDDQHEPKNEASVLLAKVAVCSANSSSEIGPSVVGTKDPNDWGIYDMLGNLQEWCLDYGDHTNAFYQQCVDNPTLAVDPKGSTTDAARILRGGSYYQGAWNATCDARSSAGGGWSGNTIGFRLTLEIDN